MSSIESTAVQPQAVDYDPFAGGELARVVPVTEPQREVWLADRLGKEASLAFNESVSLRLRGPLDRDAMDAAVRALVYRHDALRASIGPDGDTLCVLEEIAFRPEHRDLSTGDGAVREAALAERRRLAVETPFVLDTGPLFRAELLRLAPEDHVLLLTAHHIVCDGWSWWVLVRELSVLYARELGDAARTLPPAPSFSDYALAQASQSAGRQFAEDEAYWLSQFAGEAPVLELPTDRPRPAQRGFASKRIDYTLDAALVQAIRTAGARRGASLFATLLAGFSALLSRLTAQAEVVIGVPAAGQSVDDHDGLVGHCVNLLPLRCETAPETRFAQSLDAMQATLLDALEHQRYTFGTLLKKLRLGRDAARLPLCSVMFNIDQALDHEGAAFPGLALEFESNPRCSENFELFVNAVQAHGELRLECQYNTGLFDEDTVRRWLQAYECLLRGAAAAVDTPVGALPVVAQDELRALAALQPARTPYPVDLGMHQLFERQCDRAPERIALRHRERTLTYAELEARANRIAALLRARGAHPGTLVGLALDRGVDMLAAQLAILKTGAGYVPLDPAFPEDRLAYMVGDAGLAALVTQRRHGARFDLRGRPVLELDALEAELAQASPERVEQRIDPESIAYVIYTSGSTGKPKGVQVPHRAVSNFIASMLREPGIGEDDRLVAVTTLSFDIAVLELFGPLSVGAQVVLADRETAMDGHLLDRLLQDSGATLMQATPSSWRLLIDAGWTGDARFRALCGGEPLPPDLARALLSRCGQLWNLYGPTETTVWSTCARIADPDRGIPIGKPIANTSIWVLDAQGQPCPRGVPGELCIGGDGVTLGYLGREELTAERFVPDPHSDRLGAKLYRTGDRGRWRADGTLEHLGRLDFQVKLRGYRIEPGEIEAALAACPGVGQALVLVREDRPGDLRLVGYVVPRTGAGIDEGEVLKRLRTALPEYMVPQHLMAMPSMPLLPNGKIDRKALPAPIAVARNDDGQQAPRTALEAQVMQAMAQVLGLPQIGIHEDFFAAGGHSLLAAQLTTRLNRDLGVQLSLRSVFDGPTVARLAKIVDAIAGEAQPARQPIVLRQDQSRAPLSPMQDRCRLIEEFNAGTVSYNNPSAHRLTGPLDVDALDRAFRALAQRQSVLRTSIGVENGEPVQVVHETIDPGLRQVEDLSALPSEQREAELSRRMRALVEVPFADLGRAPLFVARLYRLAAEEHVLFFMPHHVIWDGWSFDLLYSDLAELYAAQVQGRAPALPELPVSYGDFAAWYLEWLKGPEYAAQVAFWRARLGRPAEDGERLRALPTDMPRRRGMSGRSASFQVELPHDAASALHAASLRMDSTLFVTLLAAYFALIGRMAGQREIVIGTPVRGRNTAEVENLMGYFINLLPIRLAIDPTLPFPRFVAQVKAAVLESFAHPDVRLEDLSRELSLRSEGGGSMLYHALFSFQDIRQRVTRWGDLEHRRVEVFQPGATEDLGLWFIEEERGLTGGLIYNADILHEHTVDVLRRRLLGMLQAIAADPDRSVAELTRFDDGHGLCIGQIAPPLAHADTAAAQETAVPMAPSVPSDWRIAYLAELWSDLLGAPAGRDDNFFDLGGNSMLAAQMAERVVKDTGVRIRLMQIAVQSLAELASFLPQERAQRRAAGDGLMGRMRRLLRGTGS
jgi:amino acid adenylation domain-containing protein